MLFKKGLGPIVATALLLVVGVVSVVSYQIWFDTFNSGLLIGVESDSNLVFESNFEILNLIDSNLYVNFQEEINISDIKLNGESCFISGTFSSIQILDLSNCLHFLNNSIRKVEVSIFSQNGIKSKFFNLAKNPHSLVSFDSNSFISLWDTRLNSSGSSDINQISLPLISGGSYNFIVFWGDGTNSTITNINQPEVTHTYSNPGIYVIIIQGNIQGIRLNPGDRLKLLNIMNWGNLKLGNNGNYFFGAENLEISARDILNLTGTTNLRYMFYNARSLTTIPTINLWNVSSIITTSHMFMGSTNFNADLSNWNTSNLINSRNMFYNADSFNSDISNWDVSQVTTMHEMFWSADSFNQNLSSWNVSQVTSCLNAVGGVPGWTLPKPNFTNC